MQRKPKPPRLEWRLGQQTVQAMIVNDGTLVWRNPALQGRMIAGR